MKSIIGGLKQKVSAQQNWVVVLFAAATTFAVYTCMYGFRKAFTAAPFSNQSFLGIDFKVWLVCAQVLGYMLSKFYGIRFIAENDKRNRSGTILKLIIVSWLALFAFAVIPAPFNIIFLFANGFPLGMIWGLVFSFIEGRRATEFMGAVLASSFIFASGFAKTIGTWLTEVVGVAEHWMPFTAGALYFVPLVIFTLLLEAIPNPGASDIAQRNVRLPMNKEQRKEFLREFAPGLILLIIAYVLLTILRDFRDNFSTEILHEIGLSGRSNIFTQTETPVAILVLVSMSLLMWIKNNYLAFCFNHIIVIAGFAIAGISTLLFNLHIISSFSWFLLVGVGLYMGYIPINCLYFDRMIATFKVTANVGFVMYVADSFGYMGSIAVLILKEFSGLHLSWTSFFSICLYVSSAAGIFCTVYTLSYYKKKFYQSIAPIV